MSVVIVTDSSAVVPRGWTEELPVHVVPLEVAWPDGTIEPGDRKYSEVAERMRSARTAPKTGAPSPGSYAALYEELLARADGVLVVCPASELSATYQSATLAARQRTDDRVRVLDAKTAAAGQGIVAVEAARVAAHGADLDVVCSRALAVASRVHIWATMAQLDFLRRSGRLPAIAAIGAGALHLHPIVRYAGSSPTPVGIARSDARAASRLYRAWERSIPGRIGGAALHAVAFHSARHHDAQELIARIASRAPGAEAATVEVTASLAAHTGPGLLGLAWFWDETG